MRVFDSGIWLPVKTGVRGLVALDENNVRHVYPILEPASDYYEVMCKSSWMPCLAGQLLDGRTGDATLPT